MKINGCTAFSRSSSSLMVVVVVVCTTIWLKLLLLLQPITFVDCFFIPPLTQQIQLKQQLQQQYHHHRTIRSELQLFGSTNPSTTTNLFSTTPPPTTTTRRINVDDDSTTTRTQDDVGVVMDKSISPVVSQQSRRTLLSCSAMIFTGLMMTTTVLPVNAIQQELGTTTLTVAGGTEPVGEVVDMEALQLALDGVRGELIGEGGIPYLQQQIQNKNYNAILEFTKTYDQILRKGKMGKVKKYIYTKEQKELVTQYMNNVTFDLIGINRNSRVGQENQENAMKYVKELEEDITKFIQLFE